MELFPPHHGNSSDVVETEDARSSTPSPAEDPNSSLNQSISLLSRVVTTNGNATELETIMSDAQNSTRTRIAAARAVRDLGASDNDRQAPLTLGTGIPILTLTLLSHYMHLLHLDIAGEDLARHISAWEVLARQMRRARQRWDAEVFCGRNERRDKKKITKSKNSGGSDREAVVLSEEIDSITGRQGPTVTTLLNPILRPLILDLLQRIVEIE